MQRTTIPIEYVRETCKIGQEAACCRFLGGGPKGFECLKNTSLHDYLNNRAAGGLMVARASNCDGWEVVRERAKKS